jgi:hypothetical protein
MPKRRLLASRSQSRAQRRQITVRSDELRMVSVPMLEALKSTSNTLTAVSTSSFITEDLAVVQISVRKKALTQQQARRLVRRAADLAEHAQPSHDLPQQAAIHSHTRSSMMHAHIYCTRSLK